MRWAEPSAKKGCKESHFGCWTQMILQGVSMVWEEIEVGYLCEENQ